MNKDMATFAEKYYKALAEKNMVYIEKQLHPDVRFIGPLGEVVGKDNVLDHTKKFAAFFKTLKMRAQFGAQDQAMIVYDVDLPAPIGSIRTASLMTFQNELVIRIELFFDAAPMMKK